MSKLSSEEGRQLIADAGAVRDDPDRPLTLVPLQPAKDPRAVLTVQLPFETIDRERKAAEANDLSLGKAIGLALDLETAEAPPAEDVPEATPQPKRSRRSAGVG